MDENNFIPTVDDVAAAFGIGPAEAGSEPAETQSEGTNPPVQESSEPETAQPTEEQSAEQEVVQQEPVQQRFDNKQNAAFARMRTENSQMQKTLAMMAQALGIDPNIPQDQLAMQLQDRANATIAKANNMDPEILKRLNHLEEINNEYNRMKMQQKTELAIGNIREKYQASQGDLESFVQDLVNSGFDIAQPGVDLEQEFIRRNFDRIVQMKIDAAVKAEQERASKAGGASKPSPKQGQANNSEPHSINTISELEEALSQQQ